MGGAGPDGGHPRDRAEPRAGDLDQRAPDRRARHPGEDGGRRSLTRSVTTHAHPAAAPIPPASANQSDHHSPTASRTAAVTRTAPVRSRTDPLRTVTSNT